MRVAGTKTHDNIQSRWGGVQIMLLSPRVSRTVVVKWAGKIQKTVVSPGHCEDGGSGWTKMEQKREASSTALRSCRAGRNTAARPPRTAWCQSCRSSACRPRWGRNEHLRSNSSTSRRDSETKARVRTGWKKTAVRTKMEGRAYHPACPCRQLQDAFSWTFPVTAGEIQGLLQESLGTDVVEQEGAEAGAHRHYVLIEAHWTDAWTHKHVLVSGKQQIWIRIYWNSSNVLFES